MPDTQPIWNDLRDNSNRDKVFGECELLAENLISSRILIYCNGFKSRQ